MMPKTTSEKRHDERFPPDLWPLLVSHVGDPRTLMRLAALDRSWHEFIGSSTITARKWLELSTTRWRYGIEEAQSSLPPPPTGSRGVGSRISISPELQYYKYRHIIDTEARRALDAIVASLPQERDGFIVDFIAKYGILAYDVLLSTADSYGQNTRNELREVANLALGSIRREWVMKKWRQIADHARNPAQHPEVPLELGSSLFSLFSFPRVDFHRDISDKLDALGAAARDELAMGPATMSKRDKAAIVASFLAREGFTGNTQAYYAVSNSFIDQVLINHTGIPITLGLVFKFVAARCDLAIDMCATPGHMLTRLGLESPADQKWYIDLFQGGLILTEDQVRAMFNQGQQFGFDLEQSLGSFTSDQEIYTRMARNILNAVQNRDSHGLPNISTVFVCAMWCLALMLRPTNLALRHQLYSNVERIMPHDIRLLEEDLSRLEREAPGANLAPLRTIVDRMRGRMSGHASLDD